MKFSPNSLTIQNVLDKASKAMINVIFAYFENQYVIAFKIQQTHEPEDQWSDKRSSEIWDMRPKLTLPYNLSWSSRGHNYTDFSCWYLYYIFSLHDLPYFLFISVYKLITAEAEGEVRRL